MTPSRILVRAPNWIGDAVMSLAAVRDLRRRNFPEARIEVLARPWVADLYGAVPEVDAVRRTARFREDVGALRGAFDAAVLLPNSFGSALQVFAAGIPERWGWATDGRGMLLTRKARVPTAALRASSEVYYYRSMLAALGLEVSAAPDVSLRPPAEWAARGAEILGAEGPWIGVGAGAAFGSAKQWIPARFAAVADRIRRQTGARVAVLGGPAERATGEAIAAFIGEGARVLCGETTLPELIGVLANLRLFLTNDSGPMHLASAQGVPVVAVFGSTDWHETAPIGTRHRVVREDVDCAPCKLRECPIDHRCMRLVTVEKVAAAAVEILH
jgi:heptosyltransferase II